MRRHVRFDELIEAVEELPDDAQAEFIGVIHRRLAERGRQRIVEEARQAKQEFAEGKCSEATPDDIVREIES